MKRTGIWIIVVLCCAACGNKPTVKTHQQAIEEEGFVQNTPCGTYRHYTGTVAGRAVVLNYMQYDSTVRCDYYYGNIGQLITLYKDSTANGKYYFSEAPANERPELSARWEVILSGDSISGIWVSGDGTITYPVALKEDYSPLVQKFGVVCLADSVRFNDSLPEPHANIRYQMVLPVGYDEGSGFTRAVIYRSIGCDTNNSPNIKSCLETLKAKYFDDYRADNSNMPVDDLSFNTWSQETNFWVVYNDDGLIVINHYNYAYTGGAHGNYASDYLNIDTRLLKKLELKDIMEVDEPKLIKLLEKEARKLYNAKETDSLNAYMLAEELYVPENFYVTNKGITFVYGIYEVAAFADGEINLFIPYNKIMDLLTPVFKQRMGLEATAAK